MNYSQRINLLCSLILPSKTFADVGCDHGYCTQYALEKGLCERAIISDVSKGSLDKAKTLLSSYIEEGRVTAVLGDGFLGVPDDTDQVLIAGMGGYEIVQILSHPRYGFMPRRFIFQPMHDASKLRRYVLENGGSIERDFTFVDGRKYYDVLVGGRSKEPTPYTEMELTFGKENIRLRPKEFIDRLGREIGNVDKYLVAPTVSEESKAELLERKALLEKVINDEIN